jgi:hypothetical protein
MAIEDRVESALRSPDPARTLRGVVKDLARDGISKAEIHALLEALVVQLRTRPDSCEAEEDAVLDVLDALTGWCHPSAELLRDE